MIPRPNAWGQDELQRLLLSVIIRNNVALNALGINLVEPARGWENDGCDILKIKA